MQENSGSAGTNLQSAFESGFIRSQIKSTVSSRAFSFIIFKDRIRVIFAGSTAINIQAIVEEIRYLRRNETNVVG